MFIFTLALRLGKTVKELLEGMDSLELTEWWAFFILQKRSQADPEDMAEQLKKAFEKFPRAN